MILCLASLFLASSLMAAEPVRVRVEGVEGDVLKNVEEALTLPTGLVRDGAVDRLWLEHFGGQAKEKTQAALEPFGYYRARVSTSLEGNEERGYLLKVIVEPGEPVRLAEVKVEVRGPGASEDSLKKLTDAFPLHTGDVLLHQKYEGAKGELLERARGLGYLDADFPIHEIHVSPASSVARIHLVLETGPRYLFGKATVEGALLYPEELLQRFVAFKPGEPFSYETLGKTQLNFVNSGIFKEVGVFPRKEDAVALQVPVLIRVTPAPRRSLRPGFGYGTDTGVRGSLSYKDRNMFQLGHLLTVEATLAQRFQGIGSSYLIPSSRDLQTVTGVQLNIEREDVSSYLSKLVALELNRTRSFGTGRLGTVFLRLQFERFTVGLEDSTARLIMPGIRFTERHFDDLIRPSRGYQYALEVRGTHRALGSDVGFIQVIADGGTLMSLPGRLTLATRAKGGVSVMDDPFADLPASLRFFAGGDSSVRAYAYKSLGPRDASGEVIGGKDLLQGSVELERALFESWGVSLFYDAGNAFDSFSDFRLYQGAGFGVHFYSKVGAINLGLARQIGVDKEVYRVYFTMGFQL